MTAQGERMRQIEDMVDSSSVAAVLTALAEICHEKAEHIRSNWQDRRLAGSWDKTGDIVEQMLRKLENIPGITLGVRDTL